MKEIGPLLEKHIGGFSEKERRKFTDVVKRDVLKAFEIFRRAGKQDVPGEGMGRAFVKALVRSLGGRIRCKSERGVGTTFGVALPVPVDASGGLLSMTGGGRP